MNAMMKKFIPMVVLMCLLPLLAVCQTHIKFDLNAPYFNANPASNRVVQIQPLTPFPGNLITYTSSPSGIFYMSNAWVSDYACSIRPRLLANEIKFQITVTATNLGVLNADEITSLTGQQTYPATGKSAWSIQASDQRYSRIGVDTTVVGEGLGIDLTTNGATVTIAVEGGVVVTNNRSGTTTLNNLIVGENFTNATGIAQFNVLSADSGHFSGNVTLDGTDIDLNGGNVIANTLVGSSVYSGVTNAAVVGTDEYGKLISVPGGGGGSATNVTFYNSPNINWRTVAGSNAADVVGTLTNPIATAQGTIDMLSVGGNNGRGITMAKPSGATYDYFAAYDGGAVKVLSLDSNSNLRVVGSIVNAASNTFGSVVAANDLVAGGPNGGGSGRLSVGSSIITANGSAGIGEALSVAGINSLAVGVDNDITSQGTHSLALGDTVTISNALSLGIGNRLIAGGSLSQVIGNDAVVTNDFEGLWRLSASPNGSLNGFGTATIGIIADNGVRLGTNVYIEGSVFGSAPSVVFTNIAQMQASKLTNGLVYVRDYWGTNAGWGAGFFRYTTDSWTDDGGTVVAATAVGTGHWRREFWPTNEFHQVWWGTYPWDLNNPETRHFSDLAISNSLRFSGNNSILHWSPFGLIITNTIVGSNWVNREIVGYGRGAHLTYPEPNRSWVAWQGSSDYSSTMMQLWSPYECTISGLGLESSTPVPGSGAYWPTNDAVHLMVIDMPNPYQQIATGVRITDCAFRSRNTNVTWRALDISPTSVDNVEGIVVDGCYFHGYKPLSHYPTNGNISSGITVGESANSRAHQFKGLRFSNVQSPLVVSNGGFTADNILSTSSKYNFEIYSWVAAASINDWFGENDIHGAVIGAAGGTGYPLTISHWHNSHAEGVRDTNSALVNVVGTGKVYFLGNALYGKPGQTIFGGGVASGYSPQLFSLFNSYYESGSGPYNQSQYGFHQFAYGESIMELNPYNTNGVYEKKLEWGGGSGDNGHAISFLSLDDPSSPTNTIVVRQVRSKTMIAPTNAMATVGSPPSGLGNDNLSVYARTDDSDGVSINFGDGGLTKRWNFSSGGNVGDSFINVQHGTGRSASISFNPTNATSPDGYFRLGTGSSVSYARYTNGSFQLQIGTTPILTASSAGQLTFAPTNEQFVVDSTNNDFYGTVKVRTNLVVDKMSVISSNAPAQWLTAAPSRGDIALVNSNGVLYQIQDNLNKTWTRTSVIPATAAQYISTVSGTPTGSKFLRDDWTWAAGGGGGGGTIETVLAAGSDAFNQSVSNLSLVNGSQMMFGSNPLTESSQSAIGGGYKNRVYGAYDQYSGVIGGTTNTIETENSGTYPSGNNAIIGGNDNYVGYHTTNATYVLNNFIGGGIRNKIFDSGEGGNAIVSGGDNTITGAGDTIMGGNNNEIRLGSLDSTIAGGAYNVMTNSDYSFMVGRSNFIKGDYSAALGSSAQVSNNNTFVWSDGVPFHSTGDNQFLINASGGVGINANDPGSYALYVNGDAYVSGSAQTARIVSKSATLTDNSTITSDWSLGSTLKVTLGGNRTLGNPSNAIDQQEVVYVITQDATGGRTLAFDTKFAGSDDLPLPSAISSVAGRKDRLKFVYDATADKFYFIGSLLGFQ